MRDAKTFCLPGLRGGHDRIAVDAGPESRVGKFADVVVDLETLGRGPGCQVLEVAAAVLCPDGSLGRFQAHPSLFDQKRLGLTVDPATLLWWLGPDLHHARAAALAGHPDEGARASPLVNVLAQFGGWLASLGRGREVRLWGNGASFDLGILGALYDAADMPRPWRFWAERDLRTLFDLEGKMALDREPGTTHVGLYDAIHELAQLHISIGQRG